MHSSEEVGGKGCQVGGKPPVKKGLGADPDSNMVEMGRDNREMVPMAFGHPDEPPQVFSCCRRKI